MDKNSLISKNLYKLFSMKIQKTHSVLVNTTVNFVAKYQSISFIKNHTIQME